MARRPKGYRIAATASDPHATVQLTGPFFAPDADARLGMNIRKMMQGIAEEGERVVDARSPRKTGAFIEGTHGRAASVKGRPWMLTAVISATHVYPWKHKGARGFTGRAQAEYRGGKIEQRYRMFRAATQQLRSARAVMAANLTAGLE